MASQHTTSLRRWFVSLPPVEYALQHVSEGFQFKEVAVEEILVGAYKDCLHEDAKNLLKNSIERMPWRLYLHKPYPHWVKGKIGLLGDAAHPMMVSRYLPNPMFAY